jgi:hypothetical protein
LAIKKIVDAIYITVELVDLAWGRDIHSGLDLDEAPIEGN